MAMRCRHVSCREHRAIDAASSIYSLSRQRLSLLNEYAHAMIIMPSHRQIRRSAPAELAPIIRLTHEHQHYAPSNHLMHGDAPPPPRAAPPFPAYRQHRTGRKQAPRRLFILDRRVDDAVLSANIPSAQFSNGRQHRILSISPHAQHHRRMEASSRSSLPCAKIDDDAISRPRVGKCRFSQRERRGSRGQPRYFTHF